MKKLKRVFIPLALICIAYCPRSYGCDLCGIYSAPDTKVHEANSFVFGVDEQYTRYDNIQLDDRVISNDLTGNQSMDSSITLVSGEYFPTQGIGLRVVAPFISRSFDRLEDGARESGSESGFGDLALLSEFTPVRHALTNGVFLWNLTLGVKLPTGSSDRLAEEESEDGDLLRHAGHDHESDGDVLSESAIHGHDLALGSGSTDVIFGTGAVWQIERRMIRLAVQYALRNEGDHDYQYADDLTWEVSPGYYLALENDFSFLSGLSLSGEHKGKDTFRGEDEEDTALTTLFVGPTVASNIGDWLRLKVTFDFPADINNSGLQAVADWRFRGGIDISL